MMGSAIGNPGYDTGKGATFTCPSTGNYTVGIVIGSGVTTDFTFKPMIRLASVEDATHEPYTGTKSTLSAPIVLRGIGDAKDRVVKKDGVYGIAREYKPFTIDGTQEVYRVATDENGYRFRITIAGVMKPKNYSTVADMLCNRFIASKWTDVYYGRANSIGVDTGIIGWYNETFKNYTVDEMKAWLTENPISGFCRLATPTFEPLPLADQIALHQLETFDTVTYISTDSNIEPIMEMEYGTSVVGAYALKGMNTSEANRLENEQLKATILSLSNALLESEV
jgi:hypothetical protein